MNLRSSGGALLSTLKLEQRAKTPLYRQLENAIREQILNGGLAPKSRLPATRQLALDLDVSRLTVKNVYEQLTTEGFLLSLTGSGTYVADIAISELPPMVPDELPAPEVLQSNIEKKPLRVEASKATTRLGGVQAFRPGVPALDKFPRRQWAAAHSHVMRNGEINLLGYGPPGGLPDLKSAIAIHVRDHRGIHCEPEQVIITAGAQQAFTMIALAALKPNAVAWSEDPGHIAVRDAMRLLGVDVKSVPIANDGFDLGYAVQNHPTCDLMFVTPSHQHPLGVTMSLPRRLELLDYAQKHNAWIIEDDYDSEFRYADRALPALLALDQSGHVLYTGSFSKSLFPALRLGYLICPLPMVEAFTTTQTLLSQNISPMQQQVLARFMLDGSFNAHIRKMRNLYRLRRDKLIVSLKKHASELFKLEPCHAGMHLIGWLRDHSVPDTRIASAIWASGIDCLPVSVYCDKQKIPPGIMFGFACADESETDKNAALVAEVVQRLV